MADFLTVYIKEAHPDERWPSTTSHSPVTTSRLFAHRLKSAGELAESGGVAREEMLVDNMDNEMVKAYGAGPLRLLIIHDGVISYLSDQGPLNYRPGDVEKYLQDRFSK